MCLCKRCNLPVADFETSFVSRAQMKQGPYVMLVTASVAVWVAVLHLLYQW